MAKAMAPSAGVAFSWRKPSDLRLSVALLAILLSGAALRLHGLDRTSLWIDEAVSWSEAGQPFWRMIQATANDDSFPLYHVILYATIRLFGDSEIALRLPSALMGIVNIYLLCRLGNLLWDRLTGVLAAALLAFSAFHLWYCQEARFYSLLCLAATAFALATVNFLSRPTWLRAALCMAAGVTLLYSHVYGVSVWVAINIAAAAALLAGADCVALDGQTWLAINGLAGLSFLAWVPSFLGQAHRTISDFWVPFPTPRFLYSMSLSIVGGAAMLACIVVLVLLSFLSASTGGKRMEDGRAEPGTLPAAALPPLAFEFGWQKMVLFTWGLVPFVIGYLISTTIRPILFDRYLIGSLPALLLLAARGLRVLCFNRFVLAGALTSLLACSFPTLHANLTTNMREDHRAAVAAFAKQFQNSDVVVCFGMYQSFAYYFRAPIAHKVFIGGSAKYYNRIFISPATNDKVVIQDPATVDVDWPDARRVWLFLREPPPPETPKLLSRIEGLYSLEREFHLFRVAVSLFIRRPGGPYRAGRSLDFRAP